MALASSLLSLRTTVFKPKTHPILHHSNTNNQTKSSYSSQSCQFPIAHLSNQPRNSRFRCQSEGRSTQESLQQDEQATAQKKEVPKYEFERLFSNLNQANFKHEPGSLISSIFLVAGTTVGAGILAIPAVTQESGFLASAIACIGCWVFMVVTGLLIAEVNVNTMRELGSGGVSLVSMAKRTLGSVGVQIACWSYLFIHYALLVAYVARSSEILTNYLDGKALHCFHWLLEDYVILEASGSLVL
uniref:Uncharacterized protein n=1 Tax=Opuntia streptacantha TaxID=393608 RepID=A0A7C9CF39_OPUST